MFIKLTQYAKNYSITYRTAWNRFKNGDIPDAIQDKFGNILIPIDEPTKTKQAAIYARVSNNDAKENLDRQLVRLKEFAAINGYIIVEEIKEIGSGLNDTRTKLTKLLTKPKFDYLIVENKDRLTRFGFNYIKLLLNNINKDVIVINETNNEKTDLIQDLISIIYSFSARIYGLRKARNKANEIKNNILTDVSC